MLNLRRVCGFISKAVRQLVSRLVMALRAHQRRMSDNPAYRASVLSALEAVVTAFAGRFASVGITVVRLYGTV